MAANPASQPTSVKAEAGRGRLYMLLAGLALLAMVAVLVFGADTTLTTPQTRRLFGLWRLRHILAALALGGTALALVCAAYARAALPNLIMLCFSTLFTFAVLEGVGALGLVSWPALFSAARGELGSLGTQAVPYLDASGATRQDIASAWGLANDEIPFQYKTDRHGYRNPVDRDGADVILLGDSVLVGALVDARKTVSALLEETLQRPVMQVALIGISPQREQELLRGAALDLKNKLVLQFIFEGNDLRDSFTFRQEAAGAPQESESTTLTSQIWAYLTALTDRPGEAGARDVCTIGAQQYAFLWTRRSFSGFESEADNIAAALSAFAAELKRAGARFAVVYVPTKFRTLADLCAFPPGSALADKEAHLSPLHAQMRAWSARSGIAMLDLTEPLKTAAAAGAIPWFWGDTHWNEAGHAVAARAIAGWDIVNGPGSQ